MHCFRLHKQPLTLKLHNNWLISLHIAILLNQVKSFNTYCRYETQVCFLKKYTEYKRARSESIRHTVIEFYTHQKRS